MFPVHDWQFWVVTALALGAAVYLLRGVIPGLKKRRSGKSQRTSLTVGGRSVGR